MVTVVTLYCKNVRLQVCDTNSVVDYALQLKEIGSRNYLVYLVLSKCCLLQPVYKLLSAESLSDFYLLLFILVEMYVYSDK